MDSVGDEDSRSKERANEDDLIAGEHPSNDDHLSRGNCKKYASLFE